MALVRNGMTKLLGEGLAKQFRIAYDDVSNAKFTPIFKKIKGVDKYALGFRISRQMIEDDLYGGIVKRRRHLEIRTIYLVDVGGVEVKRSNETIYIGNEAFMISDAKDLVKVLNKLIKLNTKVVKKTVKRRRRKNAKA